MKMQSEHVEYETRLRVGSLLRGVIVQGNRSVWKRERVHGTDGFDEAEAWGDGPKVGEGNTPENEGRLSGATDSFDS
jgi:hypothetical protein